MEKKSLYPQQTIHFVFIVNISSNKSFIGFYLFIGYLVEPPFRNSEKCVFFLNLHDKIRKLYYLFVQNNTLILCKEQHDDNESNFCFYFFHS